jgi:hypothetical protein
MKRLKSYKCYKSESGNTFVYLGKVDKFFHKMMYITNQNGIYSLGDMRNFNTSWKIICTLEEIPDDRYAIMLAKILQL